MNNKEAIFKALQNLHYTQAYVKMITGNGMTIRVSDALHKAERLLLELRDIEER